MGMNERYAELEPARVEIDAISGPAVLEFGAPWCRYCIRAQALIGTAFERHPGVRHIKVEDGKGRPLGRSFRVKLWPTLVFLRDGQEVERLVRPADAGAIGRALARIDAQ
jgi:thioredoxin 1